MSTTTPTTTSTAAPTTTSTAAMTPGLFGRVGFTDGTPFWGPDFDALQREDPEIAAVDVVVGAAVDVAVDVVVGVVVDMAFLRWPAHRALRGQVTLRRRTRPLIPARHAAPRTSPASAVPAAPAGRPVRARRR